MQEKTVGDVIQELRAQGIVISLSNALRLINNAVGELVAMYDSALRPVELDITAKAREPYFIETLGVKSVKVDDVLYYKYKADPHSITFEDDGEYQVTVLMYPDDVTGKDDELPVHTAYHPAIVQYVAYYAQPIDPDGKPKTNEMFYALAQVTNTRLSRIKRKGSIMSARIWR